MKLDTKPLIIVCLSLVAIFLIISYTQSAETLKKKDAQIMRLETKLEAANKRLSDTKQIGPAIWGQQCLGVKTNMSTPEFLDLLATWLKEENLDVVIHKGKSK